MVNSTGIYAEQNTSDDKFTLLIVPSRANVGVPGLYPES